MLEDRRVALERAIAYLEHLQEPAADALLKRLGINEPDEEVELLRVLRDAEPMLVRLAYLGEAGGLAGREPPRDHARATDTLAPPRRPVPLPLSASTLVYAGVAILLYTGAQIWYVDRTHERIVAEIHKTIEARCDAAGK